MRNFDVVELMQKGEYFVLRTRTNQVSEGFNGEFEFFRHSLVPKTMQAANCVQKWNQNVEVQPITWSEPRSLPKEFTHFECTFPDCT